MSLAALVTGTLLLLFGGVKPNEYSERSLCDLQAGATCHATQCLQDARQRCAAASRKCRDSSPDRTVPKEQADKAAACARALLLGSCGDTPPSSCGVWPDLPSP